MNIDNKNNFENFPLDLWSPIVTYISRKEAEIIVLRKLTIVCQQWKKIFDEDRRWERPFSIHMKSIVYEMDLSSATTWKAKLKLSIETRRNDFQKRIEIAENKYTTDWDQIKQKKKGDFTEQLLALIDTEEYKQLALCLLHKPSFDAMKIASHLINVQIKMSYDSYIHQFESDCNFCFRLLFKLHFDLSKFFEENSSNLGYYLGNAIHAGITLSDLSKCGLDLSKNWSSSNNTIFYNSSFSSCLEAIFKFYRWPQLRLQNGSSTPLFMEKDLSEKCVHIASTIFPSSWFTHEEDPRERLRKYISTVDVEGGIEQFLRDILFNSNLSFNISMDYSTLSNYLRDIYSLPPQGGCESALTILRYAANSRCLPEKNALKTVLEEYDSQQTSKI